MKSRGKALPGGGEPRERPGRLRGGRDAAPAPGEPFLAALVRAAVLAEAPVLVLVRLDPGDGAPHGRVVGGEAGRRQGGKRGARAVDVVHAPAAEPRAVLLLPAQEVGYAAPDGFRVAGPAGQELDDVGGDVRARRGGDGAGNAEREGGR